MSELRTFFQENKANSINKWIHYFDIYESWFDKYKNKPVVILEIGVFQGGSLNMWRSYFGENAQIFGIDINPECKQFETEKTKIFIGSQEDRNFLKTVKKQIPKIDILIDDGGHYMNQQIVSFEELYGHIKEDGVYLCEDLHTSYWKNYGGGFKKQGSFIEYSKNLIDRLNAWHSREGQLNVDEFTRSTHSIHYYDSILVIKKGKQMQPVNEMRGQVVLAGESFKEAYQKEENRKRSITYKYQKMIKTLFKKLFKMNSSLDQKGSTQ